MSIEQDLQTARISHLDLSHFALVKTGTVVDEVLEVMRRNRVNAVLIEDGEGKLAGIFTGRDAVLKVVDEPSTWKQPIDAVMTSRPHTALADESVGHALRLMNETHIRNLPVLDARGNIVGNLSHYALVRFLTDRFPREIYNLPPDPELFPRTREGA